MHINKRWKFIKHIACEQCGSSDANSLYEDGNQYCFSCENFIPGRAYNVGSKPEWEMDIKEYSDIVLKVTAKDDSLIEYKEAESFTTKIKTVDFSKAIKDLDHNPLIGPEEGIRRTAEWMKDYYRL